MFLYSAHASSLVLMGRGGGGGGRVLVVNMDVMLDESQMTVCRCHSVQISYEFNLEKHFLLRKQSSLKKKKCLDSSSSLFLSSFLWSVLICHSFFFFVSFSSFSFSANPLLLYKKHTGPTSTPNSWSAPPISMGAMSTMGRREVFCDLYSITVLPQCPVCFCAGGTFRRTWWFWVNVTTTTLL